MVDCGGWWRLDGVPPSTDLKQRHHNLVVRTRKASAAPMARASDEVVAVDVFDLNQQSQRSAMSTLNPPFSWTQHYPSSVATPEAGEN